MDSVLISLMGFSGFSRKHFQMVLINFSKSIRLREKHTIILANELLRGSCQNSALDLALDSLPRLVFQEEKGQHPLDPFSQLILHEEKGGSAPVPFSQLTFPKEKVQHR